jgi:hypothetical protein
MPRYLVERLIPHAGELTAIDLKNIVQQSMRVQQEMESWIQWMHSTVTEDRMFCLLIATDEEAVREHGLRSGLPIHRIMEVSAIIDPLMDDLI